MKIVLGNYRPKKTWFYNNYDWRNCRHK